MAKVGLRAKRKAGLGNVHESFSDVALLMLATFIFLLVTILITTKVQEQYQVPKLREQVEQLQQQLASAQKDRERLLQDLGEMAGMNVDTQMERVLSSAHLDSGEGRKDFELFVAGLKTLPGRSLHLVVDATGSMHGVASFLVPVLRVIVVQSGKQLDAITWFSAGRAETYQGSMGEMLDQLMEGAPFVGSNETIGDAFYRASHNSAAPGAYVLIGDEPSDDSIYYRDIPSPVFTIPIGNSDPETTWEYQTLADKTGGKMLSLTFQ